MEQTNTNQAVNQGTYEDALMYAKVAAMHNIASDHIIIPPVQLPLTSPGSEAFLLMALIGLLFLLDIPKWLYKKSVSDKNKEI